MRRAAFFDRDGTLIKDVGYLSAIEQVEILTGAVDLCLQLQREGYLLFVVTNQSGVARGYFAEEFVVKTHNYLADRFAKQHVYFTRFYYCPHHPEQNCLCRKPSPGMLEQAAAEFQLDLTQSLMFGDKECDVVAGARAGCQSFYIQEILKIKGVL